MGRDVWKLGLAVWLMIALDTATAHAGEMNTAFAKADKVLVLKGERRMVLLRSGAILKSYSVALGRNPLGPKTRQGDGRTPEGTYALDWRNRKSKYYRSIHITYPSPAERKQSRLEGVSPGGDIMIHGLPNGRGAIGSDHAKWDWTEGCIAVTNDEMDEIWSLVDDGTPIDIRQ